VYRRANRPAYWKIHLESRRSSFTYSRSYLPSSAGRRTVQLSLALVATLVTASQLGAGLATAASTFGTAASQTARVWAAVTVDSPIIQIDQPINVTFAATNLSDMPILMSDLRDDTVLVINGKEWAGSRFTFSNGARAFARFLQPGKSMMFLYQLTSVFKEPGLYRIVWPGILRLYLSSFEWRRIRSDRFVQGSMPRTTPTSTRSGPNSRGSTNPSIQTCAVVGIFSVANGRRTPSENVRARLPKKCGVFDRSSSARTVGRTISVAAGVEVIWWRGEPEI
jgi:hypothetical protein